MWRVASRRWSLVGPLDSLELYSGVVGVAMIFDQLAVGVLHYTKPAGGVSSACRTLV